MPLNPSYAQPYDHVQTTTLSFRQSALSTAQDPAVANRTVVAVAASSAATMWREDALETRFASPPLSPAARGGMRAAVSVHNPVANTNSWYHALPFRLRVPLSERGNLSEQVCGIPVSAINATSAFLRGVANCCCIALGKLEALAWPVCLQVALVANEPVCERIARKQPFGLGGQHGDHIRARRGDQPGLVKMSHTAILPLSQSIPPFALWITVTSPPNVPSISTSKWAPVTASQPL